MIGCTIAGRYKIIEPLGRGGMGETYIAIDTQFPNQPRCVVKRLLPASKDPDYLLIMQRLFQREAATLAKVGEHDQIPRLLAYPEENQEFYLVQEYIEGHLLSTELQQRWSELQVLEFLKDILGVLEFLQNKDPQVIHRDIKPANIIRRKTDRKLVLIDFGAVKEWQAQQLTRMGKPSVVIGTPEYMPAEQFRGKPRPSSDLYAVGMIAIQSLTGLLPSALDEDEDGEKIWRSKALINDGLADFLATMVRHDFKNRYQTAAQANQALQNLMIRATTVVTPRPATPPPQEPTQSSALPRYLENKRKAELATPQKPKQSSSLPSTVYQALPVSAPPASAVPANKSSQSRRTFLKRALYIVLGTIGTLSTAVLAFVIAFLPKRLQFKTASVDAQGSITEQKTGEAEFFTEDLGNNIALDMMSIPGGSFIMGSPNSEIERAEAEGPQRAVTLQPFYMGKYAVTQSQWKEVAQWPQVMRELAPNPSNFKGANLPVENVSWVDAVEFCRRLSKVKGKTYRLPSEAEWEYACRAGTVTPFHFGQTINTNIANYRDTNFTEAVGKYRKKTTEVGSFPANAFGLYDMHGNVYEWCEDYWSNYTGAPSDGSAWVPVNASSYKDWRVLRGGSWESSPNFCRSASRTFSGPSVLQSNKGHLGFRVVFEPQKIS